jgi:hypothetical protein
LSPPAMRTALVDAADEHLDLVWNGRLEHALIRLGR